MKTNEPTTSLRAPLGVTSVTFDRDDRLSTVTIGVVRYDVAGLTPEATRSLIASYSSPDRSVSSTVTARSR